LWPLWRQGLLVGNAIGEGIVGEGGSMNEASLLDTIQRSSFIFVGTVTTPVGSSLRAVPAQLGLAVVRFERGFLTNPVLGRLEGRPITVRLAGEGAGASAVSAGERLMFFATAWVHSEEIGVNELGRLPADEKTEQEVMAVVASLPERHLADRLANAALVVQGTVDGVSRATDIPGVGTEHDPGWMRAQIESQEVLKGEVKTPAGRGRRRATVAVLFPGSGDRAFRDAPRFTSGQTAVFVLHQPAGSLPAGSLIAPDPADVQPVSQLAVIRGLLGLPSAAPG
jgi:hypothetical protein